MLSYDGVIKKRLRFKGDPPLPEFPPIQAEADHAEGGLIEADAEPEEPRAASPVENEKVDERTDAQRRFDEQHEARESERLRKVAAESHRERIAKYNEKLAKQPEHFDMFKTSFTK